MPATAVKIPPFNYAALAEGDREFVRGRADMIRGALKRSVEAIIEVGDWLAEVRAVLMPEDEFDNWLSLEFDLGRTTAYRWMTVSKQFPHPKLGRLPIEPTALYLLAAPGCPERHREEAIRRAEAGERITYTVARSIIRPPPLSSGLIPESADSGHHARAKLVAELESWYADAEVDAWRQLAAAAGVKGPFWAHLRAALEQANLTLAVAREG